MNREGSGGCAGGNRLAFFLPALCRAVRFFMLAMIAAAQDIAEPQDEEAPSLVISKTTLDLYHRQVELEVKRMALLKSVRDKASADAVADKLLENESMWQMLEAEREDTAPYEEVLALLYAFLDEKGENELKEASRIKDLKFYGSAALEKAIEEIFPYIKFHVLQPLPKDDAAHPIMTCR